VENPCFRCGYYSELANMVPIVWIDGSEKLLCPTCFSLLLGEKKIVRVGNKYRFVHDAVDPMEDIRNLDEISDEISEILGYTVTSEDHFRGYERHSMLKEARKLGIVPWIMSRAEFLSRRAEKICKKVIETRKQQALRDSIRGASDDLDDQGKPPDRNDPDMV